MYSRCREWKEAKVKWDVLPKDKQNTEFEKRKRERLAAEAIGDFESANSSGGSSAEADEGPIYISDESSGAKKKISLKFKNRSSLEYRIHRRREHVLYALCFPLP